MSRVDLEISVDYRRNLPYEIEIRPLLLAGETPPAVEALLAEIAYNLRITAYHEISRVSRMRYIRALHVVKIHLFAVNVNSSNVAATEETHLRLQDVTADTLMDIISRIVESNDEVGIFDLSWKLILVPASIRGGGCIDQLKTPTWVPAGDKAGWMMYSDSQGKITCAAAALALAIYYRDAKDARNRNAFDPKSLMPKMREIQETMLWEDIVTIDQLGEFVEMFPKYRVTLIVPTLRDVSDYVWTGAEFDDSIFNDGNMFGKKLPIHKYCLYVVYDVANKHYGFTQSPMNIKKKLTKNTHLFCHKCCVFPMVRENHVCGEIGVKPMKRKACKYCGIIGDHTCAEKNCGTCGSKFQENNRCILYNFNAKEKEFNKSTQTDVKKNSLWVYDIESRFKMVEVKRAHVKEFEIDDEGYYSGNDLHLHTTSLQLHVANYIYARNVFTGEVFEDFGDQCLTNFLLYFFQYNRGIFILTRS